MSNPQYGNSIRVGSLRIGGWLPVRSFVIGLGTVVATMMIILLGQHRGSNLRELPLFRTHL